MATTLTTASWRLHSTTTPIAVLLKLHFLSLIENGDLSQRSYYFFTKKQLHANFIKVKKAKIEGKLKGLGLGREESIEQSG